MPGLCDYEREILRQLRIKKSVPTIHASTVGQAVEALRSGGYFEPDPGEPHRRAIRLTEKGIEALRPRPIPDMA